MPSVLSKMAPMTPKIIGEANLSVNDLFKRIENRFKTENSFEEMIRTDDIDKFIDDLDDHFKDFSFTIQPLGIIIGENENHVYHIGFTLD